MSETTTTAEPGPSSPTTTIKEAVIRIAGNSQDGIQAIGGFLARLAGRSEQEVMTFMTIPSTISGGPSIFQVRLGTGEVLSAGDEADLLVAFYQHSYEGHVNSLRKGGVVLYDADHVEPKVDWQEDYRHVGIPISNLTVEAIGGTAKDKGKNVFVLGLLARMFDLHVPKLELLLRARFAGKNESIVNNALLAFNAGYAYSIGNLVELFTFSESRKRSRSQVVMNGNESLAYGLIAAGVRFGAGYPITPWSDIMEILRRELPNYGGTFVQCEDEIASVAMALGGSYGGRVAVTGSSGPGIALKTEAIGWGVMAEMPLVIVNVQRGGPSTGLPTSVEQSDLNLAIYGGHGDSPRIVLAPADVGDCFHTAIEAVNLARDYSVPVFILTDQAIATRIQAFEEPDLESLCQDLAPDLSERPDFKPYDLLAKHGVPHHAAPGTRILNGKYPVITGLEHDEMGHPSASPKLHTAMTAKRRNKLRALASQLPPPTIYGQESGDALLVGWGSSLGPIREAVTRALASGLKVGALHIRYLNPLPNGLEKVFARYRHVFVAELNDEGLYGYGQLASILRARYCDPRIRAINKTDGLTFKVRELVTVLHDCVDAGAAKN